MKTLRTVLNELKRLDKEATGGPWTGIDFFAETEVDGHLVIHLTPLDSELMLFHTTELKTEDQKLISTYRNQTPKLIRVIEKLIEQRDAACGWAYSFPELKIKGFNEQIDLILNGVEP
jgi:hypothetical protein